MNESEMDESSDAESDVSGDSFVTAPGTPLSEQPNPLTHHEPQSSSALLNVREGGSISMPHKIVRNIQYHLESTRTAEAGKVTDPSFIIKEGLVLCKMIKESPGADSMKWNSMLNGQKGWKLVSAMLKPARLLFFKNEVRDACSYLIIYLLLLSLLCIFIYIIIFYFASFSCVCRIDLIT